MLVARCDRDGGSVGAVNESILLTGCEVVGEEATDRPRRDRIEDLSPTPTVRERGERRGRAHAVGIVPQRRGAHEASAGPLLLPTRLAFHARLAPPHVLDEGAH